MSEIAKRETMEFSNCRLFEKSQDHHVTQASHCGLGGEEPLCNGDILYCERIAALRDYVLKKIETKSISD